MAHKHKPDPGTTWALDDERSKAAAVRLAATYGSIDRILSECLAKDVKVVATGPAPAWTDGATVYVNTSMLPTLRPQMSATDVVTWLGVNYHELGHILYSPRSDSTLLQAVRKVGGGLFHTWNLVEDQRQERLMVAQFPTMAAYYSVMVRRLLYATSTAHSVYPLLVGRRYLPDTLIATARAAWVGGDDSAQAIAHHIGAYQRLADPAETDNEVALYHLGALHQLLRDIELPPQGCGQATNPSEKGDSIPAETDTDDASDPVEVPGDPSDDGDDADGEGTDGDGEGDSPGDAPESDDDADPGTDEGDPGAGDDGEGDGAEGDDADDDGPGAGAGAGDDADDGDGDDDGDPDDEHGSASTAKGGKPRAPRIGDLREQINDTVSEVLSDPDVRREVDRARAHTQPPKGALPDAKLRYTAAKVPDKTAGIATKVSHALSQMVADVATARLRRVDTGKLVPRRYEQGLDRDSWFDRFEPGLQDETSMEVVILVDVSISMRDYQRIESASQAAWVIRRAVDSIEGRCSVIGYDTSAYAGASGKPHAKRYESYVTIGGTDPQEAMKYARSILDGSTATHRMLIVISDGDWEGKGIEVWKGIVREGRYLTVMIGLGMNDWKLASFPGRWKVAATTCDPLVPLFQKVATEAIAQAIR